MKIKWFIEIWEEDSVTFSEHNNEDIFDVTIDNVAIYLGGPRYKYSKFIERMKFREVY